MFRTRKMRRSTTTALSERGYNSATSGNPHPVEISSAFCEFSRLCKARKVSPQLCPSCARSAARRCTRSSGFDASEAIPFPGVDSIFSSRCGAISGRLHLPSASRRDPATESPRFKRSTIGSRSPPAREPRQPRRRTFLFGGRAFRRPMERARAKSRFFRHIVSFQGFAGTENFRLDLAADPIIRATGVRLGPEATSPIVSRPDAVSARPMRASAPRRAGLVAAI